MSEQEVRDGLKLAVADEPPMTFDLDELVDTAERLTRRRRALIAVGASTAAVAVAAVMIPVVLGISGGSAELPMAAPPSPVVSTPDPTATTPSKKPPLTREQLITRGTQMQEHLRTQVPAVVPNARQVNVKAFQGEAEGAVADGQNYLGSFVSFTLGTKTSIEVHVQNNQDNMDRTCAGCQQLPQPDGSVVVIQPEVTPEGNSAQMRIVSAVHFRKDGSLIRVTTYNYDPASSTEAVYQPTVALTVDQIMRLATDQALHL